MRSLALKIFGVAGRRPRKPWMSEMSWQLVRWHAPLRRQATQYRCQRYTCMSSHIFYGWKVGHCLDESVKTRALSMLQRLRVLEHWWFWRFTFMHRAAKLSLTYDRQYFYDSMASQAQAANDQGDLRTGSLILRMICGRSGRQGTSIMSSKGANW